MEKTENIKKEYQKYVIAYFLMYIIINVGIMFPLSDLNWLDTIKEIYKNKLTYTLIGLPATSMVGLFVFYSIPSNIKEVLIFWKIKNRLPSYRWQDSIIRTDSRFNMKKINKKYGKKLSKEKQHDIWYSSYQRVKEDIAVLNSQKAYLFARDMCIATLLLIPILIIIYIIAKIYFNIGLTFIFVNIGILFVIYIFLNIVCRITANRFVCNVIALDIKE